MGEGRRGNQGLVFLHSDMVGVVGKLLYALCIWQGTVHTGIEFLLEDIILYDYFIDEIRFGRTIDQRFNLFFFDIT